MDGTHILKKCGFEISDYSNENFDKGANSISKLIGDSDAAIVGLEPITSEVLEKCPNLKIISRRGIGVDSIDLDACKCYNVTVTRTAGTVEKSVAEHCIAYILHFARQIPMQNDIMHNSKWERVLMPGAKNKILGLVGFGAIGREVAKVANSLGMQVIYNCRHPQTKWETEYGVKYCDFSELLKNSDYISVHTPLTEVTKGMFGKEQFEKMKKSAVFINTAREDITDYFALAKALEAGKIRGACIDVFRNEPCTDSPLIKCKNAILTPHTASYTAETFKAMNECAAQNVVDFFSNQLNDIYII